MLFRSNGNTIGNLQLQMGSSEATAVFGVNTDCTIGVNEQPKNTWTIYPNPADEMLHVNFVNAPTHRMITLMDASGRSIESWNITQQQWTMDVHSIAPGFYVLQVDEAGTITTQTVIIR